MAKTKDRVIESECIQWHLKTSTHDRCPMCCTSNSMAYLGTRDRYCMQCNRSFKLNCKPNEWLAEVQERLEMERMT